MALLQPYEACLACYSLHTSLLGSVIYRVSVYCRCTLKTREFRTKDFVVRSTHSIERQECKYCLWRTAKELGILSFEF